MNSVGKGFTLIEPLAVTTSNTAYPYDGDSMPMSVIKHISNTLLLTWGAAGNAINDWWHLDETIVKKLSISHSHYFSFHHGDTKLNQIMADFRMETITLEQIPVSSGNLLTVPIDAGWMYCGKNP